jgi:glycosyltransferase involved in cell wall biosynthesis
MNQKKFIYISHWRFPSEKTMSPLIMRTCQEFADQGFEVELWAPKRLTKIVTEKDPFIYHDIKRNFEIKNLLTLDLLEIVGGKISFYLMLLTFGLSVFFKAFQEKNSVFYSHDSRDVFFLSFLRRSIFVEIHDFYESSAFFVNKFVLSRAKGIVSTNLIKAEKISKKYSISEEKILHKPNAVDVKKFDLDTDQEEARRKLGLPIDSKIILYTGSLFYWKGVDTLMDSAKYIPEDFYVYFVGGTDDDIEKFKEESKNIKNITVVGRKSHQEIPLWQRSADVLVLPNTAKFEESRLETSPVKLFEYMASRVPIIASKIPSIQNVVSENMVFFFEPDNPKDLAEKIISVLNDRGAVKEKVSCSRQEVEKYTWEKRVGDIINFISKIS